MRTSELRKEAERLKALHDLGLLDTPPERDFDDFVRLAAAICDVPISIVSLVDEDRQWFKSKIGLDVEGTTRDVAFCAHAIQQEGLFVVPDATTDPRFRDNPLVTGDSGIRFYAGAPLVTPEGQALGTLCVVDRRPRTLSSDQAAALEALARQVMARIELRCELEERRKAEQELRASEARKAAICRSALDCIVTMDGAGRIVEWNPAAEAAFAYAAAEAIGQDLACLIVPAALRDAHRQGLARYLATGEGWVLGKRIEITAMRAGGEEFPVELAITPIPLPGETLFTAYLRDISERRQAEQTLRDQEEQFRLLFENAIHGIYRTTPDGKILLANPALLAMLGFDTFEELAARNLETDGTEAVYERIDFKRRLEAAGELCGLEATWTRRDGRPIFVRENAHVVRDSDGLVLFYEGSVEDVTARKEAEEALRRAHDELEARVAERTEELRAANRALETEMAERRRAEESYRSLFENAVEGIFQVTPAGRYLSVNPALARLYGYESPEDLLASVTDTRRQLYVRPERRDEFVRRLQGQGTVTEFEAEVYRRDGSIIWISESARMVRNECGEPVRYEGFVEDVTERRRAEQALTAEITERQQIQARLAHALQERENVMETVPDILFRLDLSGRLVQWNRKMEMVTGLSSGQLIEKPGVELFPAAEQDKVAQAIARAFQTGYAEVEGCLIGKEGEPVPHQFRGVPLRDQNGRVIGLTGTGRDVTESKRQQAALSESEGRYRSLVDHSPEAVIVYADNRIVYANAAAAVLFAAASPADLLGRLIFDFVHPDYRALTRERAQRSQQEGKPSPLTHHKYVRLDGQVIDVEAVSTGIVYQGRRAGQVLIRDVTERIKAEEELRASKDMLQLIMDNIPQLIFWKDRQSVYQGCNRNFAQAADLTDPNEVKGLTDYDLPWPRENADSYRRDDQRIMDSDRAELHFLETQRHDDGSEGWVETNKVPLHDSLGNVVGILGTYADITELKRSEKRIRELNADLTQAYDATIEGWSRALDLRDQETEGHCRRVTELTLRLADAMGLAGDDLLQVRRGALLHDIGKMGVPDRILLKPGPLTDDEWVVMRRHPGMARDMLWPVEFLRPALDIPFCHHEKWDGTGYPQGLRGEQIPLSARLFAVVDVWDALRSDRPYRNSWPVPRVLDHIAGLAGTHFDPEVVRLFLALMVTREPIQTTQELKRAA